MKLAIERRDVSTSGVLETARATIKASRKVFSFFSDNVYANKKLAIARELVANAVDAQVMADKPDIAAEVWLPTELDPTFRVRDQGTGMPHAFVMGGYMSWADGSTKDGNNIAVGGFGLGKGSVFSYVDQYSLRSVHDGVISVYTAYLDSEGIPTIALLAQATTDESNGVEVSFAVANGDAEAFETATFEALAHFEPLPIIHNARTGAFTPPVYLSQGNGWAMRPAAGPLNIIMGGILYPVGTSGLSYDLRYSEPYQTLLGYGLDIKLPIGACDIALSREALSYTERTNAALIAAIDAVVDEVKASFSTMFDDCPTRWEAKLRLAEELGLSRTNGSYYGRSSRGQFLASNAIYQGKPFSADVRADRFASLWTIDNKHNRRGRHVANAKWDADCLYVAHPLLIETIIIDDLPQTARSRTIQRIKLFAETAPRDGQILIFRTSNPAELIEQLGHPPVRYTSDLDLPETVPRTKTSRPHVRLFAYDGRDRTSGGHDPVSNLNPGSGGHAYQKGVTEIVYADQPTTGILVTMDNFELPAGFRAKLRTGLVAWSELHFANKSDAEKLRKRWSTFDDVFESRLATSLAQYPELPQRLALHADLSLSPLFRFIRNSGVASKLSPRQQKTPFGRICALHTHYLEPLTGEQLKLAGFVSRQLPARIAPPALLDAFNSRQPNARLMIDLLNNNERLGAPLFLELI